MRNIANLQFFIFALLFLLTFYAYRLMEEQIKRGAGHVIQVVNNNLKVQKSRFNFPKRIQQLRSYGVLETMPKMAEPSYYILIHTMTGGIGALFLFMISPIMVIPGFIVGWLALDYYFAERNKKENSAMMSDIFAVTNILSTQIKGGVYVGNALAECRDVVNNKRLKKALEQFHQHLIMEDMTFVEAVNDFEQKFDSSEIASLSMILRQNEETGHIKDIIGDLARQINATEETVFMQKKAETERSLTIAILIMFCDVMFFVMWEFIQDILTQF